MKRFLTKHIFFVVGVCLLLGGAVGWGLHAFGPRLMGLSSNTCNAYHPELCSDVKGTEDWNAYIASGSGFGFLYPRDWQLEHVGKNADEIAATGPEAPPAQLVVKGPRGFKMVLDRDMHIKDPRKNCAASDCPVVRYLQAEVNNITSTGDVYRVKAEVCNSVDQIVSRHVTLIERDSYEPGLTSGEVTTGFLNNYFTDNSTGNALNRFDLQYDPTFNSLSTDEFFALPEVQIAAKIISSSGYFPPSFYE